MRLLDGTTFIYTFFYVFDEDCWLPGSYLQKNKEVIVFPSLYFLLLLFVLLFFATTDEYKEYISRLFAAYLHIRVWRYSLEGASSLEVLNIVLFIRSPSKKRGRSSWLNACTNRTTSLFLARIIDLNPHQV